MISSFSPNRASNHVEGGHVLAAAATGLLEQIERDGGDWEAVLAEARVEQRLLADIRAPIDLRCYVDAMERAAGRTRNDNFGLHFGQTFVPERLGLIGLIAIASVDLEAALLNLANLFRHHQHMTDVVLREEGGVLRLEYRIRNGAIVARRQDAELTIGMFANIFRHCWGERWHPQEIHFEHPRPERWDEHERLFNAPVYFSQRTNAILFHKADLIRRMPHADPLRLTSLRGDLLSLQRYGDGTSMTDIVRTEIRGHLVEGTCSLKAVAEDMQIPRWKVQRALDAEGVNFAALVDDVRKQLAQQYLRYWHLPLTEIALLLGYSELSAFSRSFCRWYGISPSQWRSMAKSTVL